MKKVFTLLLFTISIGAFAQDDVYLDPILPKKERGKIKEGTKTSEEVKKPIEEVIEPSLNKLDAKYGFRDAVLESDFSSFKDMVLVEDGGAKKIYTRTTDNMAVGDFPLDLIAYSFYKGKLSTIMLQTKGYLNSRGVLEALRAQYGRGYQENRYIDNFTWSGEKVLMSYKENSATNDATIFIFSKPMMKLGWEDEKKSAAKAASDL